MTLKRLLIFYSLLTAILTTSDIASTMIAIKFYGYSELNKYVDPKSIWGLAMPGVIFFGIGLVLIVIGYSMNKDFFERCREISPKEFQRQLLHVIHPLSKYLVLGSIIFAATRIIPVINNLTYLAFGWGIVGTPVYYLSEITKSSTTIFLAILNGMYVLVLVNPLIFVLHKICFRRA